jgi:TRAP-type C4-dicarboxylate transport system permease small subunit
MAHGATRVVDALAKAGAVAAAAALVLIVLLLGAEIVSRIVAGRSFSAAWVYSTYLLAIVLFGGAGHALRHEGHIRVRIIEGALSPAGRRAAEATVSLAGAAVVGVLLVSLLRMGLASYAGDSRAFTPDQTPLFIPQLALAASVLLLFLQLLLRAWLGAVGALPAAASSAAEP